MDILRRSLAPISDTAWEEINSQAKRILTTNLSARKIVDVDGPKGWDFAAVSLGRLDIPDGQKGAVKYGIRQVHPLIETRATFNLNIWELDNLTRGAEDIDLSSLEDAAREMAKFEENTIYYGLKSMNIDGLKSSSEHQRLKYPANGEELLAVLTDGVNAFNKHGIEGPYSLVVSPEQWQILEKHQRGYPLEKQIKDLLGGSIVIGQNVKDAFLVSQRGGDFKLTLGNDFSIGYESHSGKVVTLYLTESFTFQVIDPAAVVVYTG